MLTFEQISIRQNFRLNGTEQYTIFDLPIQITNSISASANSSSCDRLDNALLDWEEIKATASNFTMVPGSAIDVKGQASPSSVSGFMPICAAIGMAVALLV